MVFRVLKKLKSLKKITMMAAWGAIIASVGIFFLLFQVTAIIGIFLLPLGILLFIIGIITKIMGEEHVIGITISVIGSFLAIGSWLHNWLGLIGSPNFGLIDFTICIIGIIMVAIAIAILIYQRSRG